MRRWSSPCMLWSRWSSLLETASEKTWWVEMTYKKWPPMTRTCAPPLQNASKTCQTLRNWFTSWSQHHANLTQTCIYCLGFVGHPRVEQSTLPHLCSLWRPQVLTCTKWQRVSLWTYIYIYMYMFNILLHVYLRKQLQDIRVTYQFTVLSLIMRLMLLWHSL